MRSYTRPVMTRMHLPKQGGFAYEHLKWLQERAQREDLCMKCEVGRSNNAMTIDAGRACGRAYRSGCPGSPSNPFRPGAGARAWDWNANEVPRSLSKSAQHLATTTPLKRPLPPSCRARLRQPLARRCATPQRWLPPCDEARSSCAFTLADGKRCRSHRIARALRKRRFIRCFSHYPATPDNVMEARGRSRRIRR